MPRSTRWRPASTSCCSTTRSRSACCAAACSTTPSTQDRRVFNAGINLTHLYYGQISFVEFILERELGLLNKIYRGHWMSESYDEQFEDYVEKPWLAVVESFAIGGGCQLLCVMDRVIAEPGSYFNLPASKEGFIPGSAHLRLPRLVGVHCRARASSSSAASWPIRPEGMMICDEVVPYAEMDQGIIRNADQMVRAGFTSTVSNRKGLRVGQEPLGRLPALYGNLLAPAVPVPLRSEADRQSRAQLGAAAAAHVGVLLG